MNTTTSLTPQQLRQAADLKEKIAGLEKQVAGILGATSQVQPELRRRSAAANAATSAKMKAAWAKRKAKVSAKPVKAVAPVKVAAPVKQAKRKMSAAAKTRLSLAAKARWAKVKAAGKTKL